ncbi:surface-adhesin E family protein [Paludibacterium sp.]|uniref:surface-adhesin E family protein n=1 Tax=Paludibacterium sp. TaxID=1917523 RepID=UPI0025E62A38|nr:surface-adhesin E family protein [Paludibacterium sp.]MBV8646182.1 hypothetical protein [Paludibacterium sp.]
MPWLIFFVTSTLAADLNRIKVGEKDNREVFLYVDNNKPEIKDGIVTTWSIANVITPESKDQDAYASIRVLQQYNCTERLSRMLAFVSYSQKDGDGTVVSTGASDNLPFTEVGGDSINERILNRVCPHPGP